MDKKTIVTALESRFECIAKYLGTPSFAYEIETEIGTFRVEKDGQIRNESGEIVQLESILAGPSDTTNDAVIWAEREMRRMELESENVPDYSNRKPYGGDEISGLEDLMATEEADRLVFEMQLGDFTEESVANLEKLIASKANLIKKVLDAEDLPLERTEDALRFPWFKLPYDSEVVFAYSQLVIALCNAAKRQKRITAKEKETENEKYAFRCFLLRIGFIGDEYKKARKILLSNLDGNSAFKVPGKGGKNHEAHL